MPSIDSPARLRATIEAFNRGDWEAALRYASDDIELRRAPNSPDSQEVLRGREAVVEFFRPEVFADQRIDLHDLEVGEDAAIAHQAFTARGAGSSLPAQIESWIVYRLSDCAMRNQMPSVRRGRDRGVTGDGPDQLRRQASLVLYWRS